MVDHGLKTLVKIPCNKVNKRKIITMFMGQLFQAKCWENILAWVYICFIMAKEIGKSNGKGYGNA